ncbi:hypothetical protein DSUL_140007 [Desulfovibrionales bacterium]
MIATSIYFFSFLAGLGFTDENFFPSNDFAAFLQVYKNDFLFCY